MTTQSSSMVLKPYNWEYPVRLLNDERLIIDRAMKEIALLMELFIPIHVTFKTTISLEESRLIPYQEFYGTLASHQSGWSARLQDRPGKFSFVWDETTLSSILYGILGGSLEGASKRSKLNKREISDIEIGVIENYIYRCFMAEIRSVFSEYLEDFLPRVDNIQYDWKDLRTIYPDHELCLIYPINLVWNDDSDVKIDSKCYLVFSQTMLRNFQWRKLKWQNLKK